MNQLINVKVNENHEPVMSARELHDFLGISTPYHIWFPRMTEYGFEQNQDFAVTNIFVHNSNGGKQTQIDHIIKLDMAKEISMIQRSDKGKQARQYFLQIEKEWNSPEKVMARALQIANKRLETLEARIEENRPKVLFADAVDASHTSILVGELAKLIKQNGVEIGQNRLFQWLRDNGYLLNTNMPSQYSMERKWFEVKERTINNPDGSVRITKTTLVTGKGQVYFVNKFLQREVI